MAKLASVWQTLSTDRAFVGYENAPGWERKCIPAGGKTKARGRATWTELDAVTSADAANLFATVQNQLTLSGGRL
jgi:hypothetical protein